MVSLALNIAAFLFLSWLALLVIGVIIDVFRNSTTKTYTPTIVPEKPLTTSELIQKKKDRCREMKVPELMEGLYDYIKYYPSWIKKEDRSYVPSIVEKAEFIEKESYESKKVKIVLNNHEYQVHYKKNDHLEIYSGGEKVLALAFDVEYGNDEVTSWHTYHAAYIDGFIEGDWIEDFKLLQQQIYEDSRSRQKKLGLVKDPEEVKKDFGIK